MNTGLRYKVKVLELHYDMPSCTVCVHVVGPLCLPCMNKRMLQLFKNYLLQHHLADGRSFMAWESHLTVTALYITPEWEMKSLVLQTGPIYDLQIWAHIRQRN